MARPREPIRLIEAKGRKHLTKEEIENRKSEEIQPIAKGIKPPEYLTKNQKKTFKKIAKQLCTLEIMGETDNDALARFVIWQEKFETVNKYLNTLDVSENFEEFLNASNLLEKCTKRCEKAASDLGLTIASRCKLVIPKAEEKPPENKFNKFVG